MTNSNPIIDIVKRGTCDNCPAFSKSFSDCHCAMNRSIKAVFLLNKFQNGKRLTYAPAGKCKRPKTVKEVRDFRLSLGTPIDKI